MKITENAKTIISSALERSNKDYLHIGLIDRCHGNKSLDIRLIEKDEADNLITIEGVEIDMDSKADEFLKEFVLEGQDNGIMFIPPSDWKNEHEGCCHHEHQHNDGEGCCGGEHHHGHHHDDGECCCGNGNGGNSDCCCHKND